VIIQKRLFLIVLLIKKMLAGLFSGCKFYWHTRRGCRHGDLSGRSVRDITGGVFYYRGRAEPLIFAFTP
jgi:hypothetical protein